MGETPEEWKNSIVIPLYMKGGKQKVENYPLSSTLFKTDMNEMIVKWNQIYTKGIILAITTKINILHFAGDQVIIADTENNLQRGVFKL